MKNDPTQPENGEADLGKDSQAVSSNAATCEVQKLSSAPEEPQAAAGQALHTRLASENVDDTVSDTNGVYGNLNNIISYLKKIKVWFQNRELFRFP